VRGLPKHKNLWEVTRMSKKKQAPKKKKEEKKEDW